MSMEPNIFEDSDSTSSELITGNTSNERLELCV